MSQDRRGPEGERPPRTPWWVIAILGAMLVLFVALAVTFLLGVQHGPGMHGG